MTDGTRPLVGVVDHGAGNLVSIEQALTVAGAEVRPVLASSDLDGLHGLVLPGVGAAAPAMERLEAQGLVGPLRAWAAADRPFLGICLGLQLLFEGSDEDGAVTLGILQGRTILLAGAPTLPHIGWNAVRRPDPASALFAGIAPDAPFYFVHSYVAAPDPSRAPTDLVAGVTEHGSAFPSALVRSALAAVQFHPERSGADGLRLLANFVAGVRSRSRGAAVAV